MIYVVYALGVLWALFFANLVVLIVFQDWFAKRGWITLQSDCSHADPWW